MGYDLTLNSKYSKNTPDEFTIFRKSTEEENDKPVDAQLQNPPSNHEEQTKSVGTLIQQIKIIDEANAILKEKLERFLDQNTKSHFYAIDSAIEKSEKILGNMQNPS